ncbi:winged helix-turn-helix domain-containing protein [Streptomyces sp. NBC_00631]|uniref:helix-turn-helix domain-containing protein n=1 Tax=Streptomyces sp. NBC_00631 TaxID=2975793 RepID=UPI0030E38A53
MDLLLHRIGWSVQVPSRKATERDEEKIATWKDEQWPVINKEGGGPGLLALVQGNRSLQVARNLHQACCLFTQFQLNHILNCERRGRVGVCEPRRN